ncbi:hypothetical protein T11_2120 [Trichinella zimbabwensis]|uniref:Uncharacterized protein n=1 Tax=Trichinella zimbabwensis TaxID=268475 RepID=A0A0V1HM03_9BILA|nr:hypothetical protein T11_2120 [Trichinella zimbabwensis]
MHGQSVEMLRKSKISDVEQRWHRRAVKAASVEFNSAGQFLSLTYRQPRIKRKAKVKYGNDDDDDDERKGEKLKCYREGCPSEAQEDVDWLTATDALVSRAPVGHVDRPGGVWPIRNKEVDRPGFTKSTKRCNLIFEGACEDRAPEYFQKRICRSVVMTCRRFQHVTRESI